jgi:hypothetical protein
MTADSSRDELIFMTFMPLSVLRTPRGGSSFEPDFRIIFEQFHRSGKNTEIGGPQMGVQILTGIPLLHKVNDVISLDIHIAIAAYTTLLSTNRDE